MNPIKEFNFGSLNKEMSLSLIKEHNRIYREVERIKSKTANPKSKNYLDIFLDEFQVLNEKDESVVRETVMCASIKKIHHLVSLSSKTAVKGNELLDCNKLTNLAHYKNLQKKKVGLEYLSSRDKDQDEQLNKIETELNGTIKLKALLNKIFDYSGNRKLLLQYYESINYKVCAYCLAQYTSIYRSSSKKKFYLKGNLDHVKAKSTYPVLSVSLNNLVPVCAHCNQRKSSTIYKYDPFNEKHRHSFDFSDCVVVDKSTSQVKLESLKKLKLKPKSGKFKDLSKRLDFKDLYTNFSFEAEQLIERYRKFNSDGYKDHLDKIMDGSIPVDLIEYFVSETPLTDDNIMKQPLTKFKTDLFNEIKHKDKKD